MISTSPGTEAHSAPLFDSHCHLDADAFDGEDGVDAAVRRALDGGVGRMLTVGSGYGVQSARRAVQVAARHPQVWAAVGLHPHDASHWSDALADELSALAAHPRVVALGEMGLDFHYDHSPRDVQRDVLRQQVGLALRLDLPIIIHDRSSEGQTLRILDEERAFAGAGVLFHCFSGTQAEMEQIVARGGYVSVPGIVTFKKADEMRRVAQATPLNRLLIETDSPYLTPVPHRGRRNEPARVMHVARKVAELRGLELTTLAAATWDNASRFYGLDR